MRERVRILDGCLAELEDALERGEVVVSTALAGRLAPVIGGLEPGIAITVAQELVFRQQEMCLADRQTLGAAAAGGETTHGPQAGMTAKEAHRLTERIRAGAQNLCELVFEAHKGRAWVALGYQSWENYVREEFNLSRSRSYELVDQGRVLQVLSTAAKVPLRAGVSPYAVREIRRYVPELAEEIRARVSAGVSNKEAREIVVQVVQDKRRAIAETRIDRSSPDVESPSRRLSKVLRANRRSSDTLADVILYLTSLPPPPLILKSAGGDLPFDKNQVSRALSWLTRFAEEIGAVPVSTPARRAG
jgi:hypothetical protein